jgi:uncharacterized coiled-coil protein SlyX
MSKSFKAAVQATRSLQRAAQARRDPLAALQADVIARLVKNLAHLERGLDDQGRQLSVLLGKLQRGARAQRTSPPFNRGGASSDDPGYYVQIAATGACRAQYRAADTGLVGRRVGRGPVRMAASGSALSTKAMSAAFGRLLAAQAQLQQLRSEMERIRQRK